MVCSTPARSAAATGTRGKDFLALTDHFIGAYDYPMVDTRPFCGNDFTTIIGAELHSGATHNGELWHILAVGLPFDFTPLDTPGFHPVEESAPAIARRARDAGAFVAVAHPQWSGLSLADARTIEAAHAVEIYNHGCWAGGDRADGWAINDLLLSGRAAPVGRGDGRCAFLRAGPFRRLGDGQGRGERPRCFGRGPEGGA